MAQTITMENIQDAFDLILQLGGGSKGQVWLAHSPGHPGGPIALKLLEPGARPGLSAGGQLWESLGDHPNVVRVLEASWMGPHPYIAMEYVDGPSLRVVLELSRGRQIPLAVSMHIMRGLLHGLAFAHSQVNPVIHGGLGPDSVLIESSSGTTKIDDFAVGSADGVPDTIRGRVMDRLRHLAPEQLAGRRPTVETDLYAAGILLHELLFGMGPFEHLPMLSLLSPNTRALASVASDLPDDAPLGLMGIVRRALATTRYERFGSAREMLTALQPYLPTWEEGARLVSMFTQRLARQATAALASVDLPQPVPSIRESAWEPSIDGSAVDQEPTDRFAAVTAVSWTSTHRIEPASGVAKP
jgi:serine/threonine protein kinase